MKSNLKDLLPRWEIGFLVSVFAIGFFITLLSVAMMISDAAASQAYCREYQTKIMIAGKEEMAYGTACLKPDGAWQIQKDSSGNARVIIAESRRVPTQRSIVVVPAPRAEAVYFDDEVIVLEDWRDEPEVFYYQEAPAGIIVGESHPDTLDVEEIYIFEDSGGTVILEDEDGDETIILD